MTLGLQYSLYSMLPGKMFLESIKTDNQVVGSKMAYKLNLVLNGIYYDELKQYHTKYLCVTANDVLTLELYAVEHNQLQGVVSIADVYKHMIDNRTVDLKVMPKNLSGNELTVKVSFQTVSAYRRKSPSKSKEDPRRVDESFARSPPKEREKQSATPSADMSFRNTRDHLNDTLGNTSRNQFQTTAKLKFEGTVSHEGGEGESLESLAQQRQKILGQLFGKFKRQR